MISYDYEPIYAMGSMLGVSDSQGLLKLLDDADRLGVDVMSAGVVLAWTTEALEKGLIKLEDLAGVELKWGDHEAYRHALKMIIEQPNDLYRALAHGVEYSSSQYGGADFALAFGGNEMPGYHTGPAAYAGILMGSRHSHLDSSGYSIDLNSKNHQSASEIADALIAEETWRQILSSAVICFFARGVYTQERIAQAFDIAGCDMRSEALLQIGSDTLRRKYAFKIREGLSPEKLRIPQRILETPSASGIISESLLRKIVSHMNRNLRSL